MLMASRVGTLWSLGNLIDLEFNLCSIKFVRYSAIDGISYRYYHCGTVCVLEDKG
jgi:hypothetical protein